MPEITIVELNKLSGFTGQLKITGSEDVKAIELRVHEWCETNNSLLKSLNRIGDHFIAETYSDDY